MSTTRKRLAAVGLITAIAVLGGCASTPQNTDPDSATLTFVGYGGSGQDAMIEAWQDPYTEENPDVTFVNTSPPDVAQVKAQVESGSVQWDVMATAAYAAEQNCGTLFEKLDLSGVDTAHLIDGTIGECYIGNWLLSTPFAYRTEAYPDPETAPKTLADFFDTEAFPGPRGVVTNLQNGILEYGSLAAGTDPDDVYPLDVDLALEQWDTVRDETIFAPNVGALQQAVESKQVDMFFLPDSRLVAALDNGTDLEIVWDQTVANLNVFAVPLGTSNKAAVEKFLESVPLPDRQASIAEQLGVTPVNTTAEPELGENQQQVALGNEENTGVVVTQDTAWYAENYNEVSTKLTNWLAG